MLVETLVYFRYWLVKPFFCCAKKVYCPDTVKCHLGHTRARKMSVSGELADNVTLNVIDITNLMPVSITVSRS